MSKKKRILHKKGAKSMKIIFFIEHTEFTSIPRAVDRYPQQKAVCLTGRADRADLENHFFHIKSPFSFSVFQNNNIILSDYP